MTDHKIVPNQIKDELHSRSKHREKYKFNELVIALPELAPIIIRNEQGDASINFSDPKAVKLLNQALLKHFYNIEYWAIPDNYLCPPIPGRVDYLHHVADLLSNGNKGRIPKGTKIKVLDIGVGANCIYPILGNKEYGWSFVGSEVDKLAVQSAEAIISKNGLDKKIQIRLQENIHNFFRGVVQQNEYFDLCICNPPFHSSAGEAMVAADRKFKKLNPGAKGKTVLNFGGKSNELWCEGGEEKFIRDMIYESKLFSTSCLWFTAIVSKEETLKPITKAIRKSKALRSEIIEFGTKNKKSRIVAWSFLTEKQQSIWVEARWK